MSLSREISLENLDLVEMCLLLVFKENEFVSIETLTKREVEDFVVLSHVMDDILIHLVVTNNICVTFDFFI